jgi:hypothetical protein
MMVVGQQCMHGQQLQTVTHQVTVTGIHGCRTNRVHAVGYDDVYQRLPESALLNGCCAMFALASGTPALSLARYVTDCQECTETQADSAVLS